MHTLSTHWFHNINAVVVLLSTCVCIYVCTFQLYSVCICAVDSDTGRLEHGAVQWHGLDLALCCPLLRGSYDIWKLCALQFAGCHLG